MSDRQKLTRRTAIVLMGGGAAVAASETFGFSALSADRASTFATLGDEDENVYLRALNAQNQQRGEPHFVEFHNRTGEQLDLTLASTNGNFAFTPATPTLAAQDDGGTTQDERRAVVEVTRGGSWGSSETEVTDTMEVDAVGSSITIDLDREFTLIRDPIETEDPNAARKSWYDASILDSLKNQAGNNANAGQKINQWRSETNRSNADLALKQGTNSSRPVYRTSNLNASGNGSEKMNVHFTDTGNEFMTTTTGTVDLTPNSIRTATLFFVLRPEASVPRRALSLFQASNTSRYIRYFAGTGENDRLAVNLDGTEYSTGVAVTRSTHYVISVVFRSNSNDDIDVDIYLNTDQSNSVQASDQLTDLGGSLWSDTRLRAGRGESVDSSNRFLGRIAEVQLFDGVLGKSKRNEWTTYLTTKWNV